MHKLLSLSGTLVTALCIGSSSYAGTEQNYEDYVRKILKSTTNGGNVEEKLFDQKLLVFWSRTIKKNKCFTAHGIDAELTMAQDSDTHDIRIHKTITNKAGAKVRATYKVFGGEIDKEFYLVNEGGKIKLYDVCDHPSGLGDKCYRHIIEKGVCSD